ncbi:MAG: WD40 repeat domain-containing protein [Myxococcota bacterium]
MMPENMGGPAHMNLSTFAHSLAFSQDGERLFCQTSHELHIWSTSTGELLQTITLPQHTHAPRLRLYADRLAAITVRQEVHIYELSHGARQMVLMGFTDDCYALAWSPDGSKIAAGGSGKDKRVRVWEVASGQELHLLKGCRSDVADVAWSPSGDRIAAVGDKVVRVYDTATGKRLHQLKGHTAAVRRIQFDDEDTLYTYAPDPKVSGCPWIGEGFIWDLTTGIASPSSFRFLQRGTTTIGPDGPFAQAFRIERGDGAIFSVPLSGFIGHCALTPTGNLAAMAGALHSELVPFDVEEGVQREHGVHHPSRVAYLNPAPGEQVLSVGSTAILWDPTTGSAIEQFKTDTIEQATLSLDGDLVALATLSCIYLRRRKDNHILHTLWLKAHKSAIRHLHFTPDGRALLSIDAGRMSITRACMWDVASGELLWTIRASDELLWSRSQGSIGAVYMGADTIQWITNGLNTFEHHDPATGQRLSHQKLGSIGHNSATKEVAIAPDGSAAARVFHDGTLMAWDLPSGDRRWHAHYLDLLGGTIYAMTISEDAQWLATHLGPHGLRRIKLADGTVHGIIRESMDTITALLWSGSNLVLGRSDGTVAVVREAEWS